MTRPRSCSGGCWPCRNDLGLLSEEYDPRYGRQVGNTPQAFSHVPLIQAALNLDRHAGAHSRVPDGECAARPGARRTVTAAPRPAADPGDYRDLGDVTPGPAPPGPRPHILVVNGRKVRQPVFIIGAPHASGIDLAGPVAQAVRRLPLHAGPALGHPGGAGLRLAAVDLPGEARGRRDRCCGTRSPRPGTVTRGPGLPGLHQQWPRGPAAWTGVRAVPSPSRRVSATGTPA